VNFFFAKAFRSFLAERFWSLKHFGHLSHTCINLKLTTKVFFSLYVEAFWLKSLNFFSVISKAFQSMTKKSCLWSKFTSFQANRNGGIGLACLFLITLKFMCWTIIQSHDVALLFHDILYKRLKIYSPVYCVVHTSLYIIYSRLGQLEFFSFSKLD